MFKNFRHSVTNSESSLQAAPPDNTTCPVAFTAILRPPTDGSTRLPLFDEAIIISCSITYLTTPSNSVFRAFLVSRHGHRELETQVGPYLRTDQFGPWPGAASFGWRHVFRTRIFNVPFHDLSIHAYDTSSTECSAQGQVLHCKRSYLDCGSAEGIK